MSCVALNENSCLKCDFQTLPTKERFAIEKKSIPGMSNERVCVWLGAANKQPKKRNKMKTDRCSSGACNALTELHRSLAQKVVCRFVFVKQLNEQLLHCCHRLFRIQMIRSQTITCSAILDTNSTGVLKSGFKLSRIISVRPSSAKSWLRCPTTPPNTTAYLQRSGRVDLVESKEGGKEVEGRVRVAFRKNVAVE